MSHGWAEYDKIRDAKKAEKPKIKKNTSGLIKQDNSPEKASERAKKARQAQLDRTEERKKLKDELDLILSSSDTQAKMCKAIVNKATKGDVRAFTVIRDTIGEAPVSKLEVDDSTIEVKITVEE